MANWLIVGATSGIAQHLIREFAANGHQLYLADRKSEIEECERIANDLKVRYKCEPGYGIFEALDFENNLRFIESVELDFAKLDGVVWLTGVMYKQTDLQVNPELVKRQHEINYTSAVSLLSIVANRMAERRTGTIVAFSSPAGDRIRKSNYFYGVDKMALSGFLDGLRMRLYESGVKVITVKPGPTATPMTAGLDSKQPLADPKKVAKCVDLALYHVSV